MEKRMVSKCARYFLLGSVALAAVGASQAMAQSQRYYDAEAGRWIDPDPNVRANVDPLPPDQVPDSFKAKVHTDFDGGGEKTQKGTR
ncbi:hypothetical protein AM571_CH02434 [Rhizobium etli 8C-3]|uniref:Uncharacterized protein n=1 Tax=Rhizobium etli 8C-3 TaxID=538025 RepID=A0A1L5P526_RHIET|nr:hypothetical protein AM571_CH02434 [Rhizobium etli 8C-3]